MCGGPAWQRAKDRVPAPTRTAPGRRHAILCLLGGGRVDGFFVGFAGDFDAARLGPVGDRNRDGEDAVLVGGVDLFGVEPVAEKELTAEAALATFAGDDLVAIDGLPVPLGSDGHRIALDAQVDGCRVDAGKVELDDEAVAVAVGVHGDAGLAGLTPGLVKDTVELAQRIETHQHGHGHLQYHDVRTSNVSGTSYRQHNVAHYVDCQDLFWQHEVMGNRPGDQESQATLAVAGFLAACRSANTRSAYQADLGHIAAWCREGGSLDLLTIDAADVARYRTACELAGAGSATVSRRLSAVASFGAFAAANGADPALEAQPHIARPVVVSESTAEVLSDTDAEALLAAADRLSRRSGVVIRLLMLDGLKVGQVIRADVSDVKGRPPRVTLDVRDRKMRTIALHPETGVWARRYLGRRREGPLILSERRGRSPERLSRFGIDYLVKQAAHGAGLHQTVSGNTLRRRYVMAAHADGDDLDDIRDNAGHADRRTTRRYLAARVSETVTRPKGE